ncbi:MAG: phosphopantothenoylcysteine decarboxylase, partial [Sphingomonadaceae bacterium]
AEMAAAVEAALPADAAVLAAAVADWTVEAAPGKLKKSGGPPALRWEKNPDILERLATSERRPRLLGGVAAGPENGFGPARDKREEKGADWMLANDVSNGIFGGEENEVHLITAEGEEAWPRAGKAEIAERLAERIADALR